MEHKGNYFRDSKDIIAYVDTLPSDKGAKKYIARLQTIAAENPDVADAANAIIARYGHGPDLIDNEQVLVKSIDDCDAALAEVEKELGKQKAEAGDKEYWLCGERFTTADLYLSILLHRLTFVGLAERLFIGKRPLV
ncbi:ganglioside-induced differentiation-associated protein 1-like [Diadema antillarum]|uniref:ganglioside-induced differentiation-associated protein 1-like n=1 Tax=Diadema antillarum TaxID=105358 RepID=UPI003A863303